MREDILKGYQLGADDYITKPFDTELLLYKIKAILQRSSTLENEEQEQFKISNIFFDSMLRQLKVGDKEYKLSPKENELLKLLCIHRNDFMPRDLALRKIWKKKITLQQEVWTFILQNFVNYLKMTKDWKLSTFTEKDSDFW